MYTDINNSGEKEKSYATGSSAFICPGMTSDIDKRSRNTTNACKENQPHTPEPNIPPTPLT
jgi:hypothetical protein